MAHVVATLSVDQVPILDGLHATVEFEAGSWHGQFLLPPGSPFLDPDVVY